MLAMLAKEFVLVIAALAEIATLFALISKVLLVILAAFVLMLTIKSDISFSNS